MEAISHNAVGRKGEGLQPLEKERSCSFVRSPPLFLNSPFVVHCLARCRSRTRNSRRAEKRGIGRTENQCNNAGSLLMMFSNQCSQPSSLLFFVFQCERKVCHCTQRIITILPLSKLCVCCAESICGTKDTDTPNGGHSLLRHSGCISIGKVHHPRAGLSR